MASSPIYFIGPLPPPVHGFSEISRRMLLALRLRHQVVTFDMAPRSNPLGFMLAWWWFIICVLRRKPKALYVALSGGHRQWIDLTFVLLAKLRGVPTFVHHHSFSYLNEKRLSAVVLFRVLRRATHIVLCPGMGEQLATQYGIELANVRVLSNVAFLDEIQAPERVESNVSLLRVGFLSNITAEKGIFEFFSVMNESINAGLALQGLIAGPVDTAVEESFRNRLAASANVRHIGAVYGVEKSEFFAKIDVLFFPTRHLEEAEPVTIFEALGHGVPVIAFARGCITGMVPAGAGAVFPYSEAYVKQAIGVLLPLAGSSVLLVQARHAARKAFEMGRGSNKAALEGLVAEIGGSILNEQVKP